MRRFRRLLTLWALTLAASGALFAAGETLMAQAACTGFQVGTTSATPDPVTTGGTETITTQVCAGSAASNIVVDLEIYNASAAKIDQRIFSGQAFAAGETKSYRWDYAVPATLPTGTYTVKIGVFSGDWRTLYRWDNQADTFAVGSGPPPPPPPGCSGTFTILPTSATPDPVASGGTETITTQVCAGSTASNIVVDLELYSASGSKTAQTIFPGQAFAAGETKSYRWDYTVPATLPSGTYTVKVGVFSGNWQTLYRWDNQADTFAVGSGPPPPPPPGCSAGFTILPSSVTPDPAAPGGTETITTKVCAGSAASNIVVDLELYDASAAKINQRVFSGEAFAAGETKSYRWDYAVPATLPPDTYTVKVGVFSGNWQTLYRWDNQAALVHVGSSTIALVPIATGLSSPVAVTHAGDGRLFITQRAGQVLIYSNGQVLPTPFLDISARIQTVGEQGLASIAFDPDYATNGYFYAFYVVPDADPVTNPGGNIRLVRFSVSATDPNVADPSSELLLLTIPHPRATEHYGGQLQFGPDGYLYVSTGDGGHVAGGPADPDGNSQNLGSLLGKLLRIDVTVPPYAVPSDNPFVGTPGARPEIWALGLRNPWRFSFDRQSGDLLLGDVGEHAWEEVDFAPTGSPGGANYGWSVMEGLVCYPPGTTGCATQGLTPPVMVYGRGQGECAIIGGYVYRGTNPSLSALQGAYLFGDYCSGRIWSGVAQDGTWTQTELLHSSARIVGFGEDVTGELYVVHYPPSGPATVYRIQASGGP